MPKNLPTIEIDIIGLQATQTTFDCGCEYDGDPVPRQPIPDSRFKPTMPKANNFSCENNRVPIMFDLAVGTCLTVLLIPVLYCIFYKIPSFKV